MSTTKEGNSVLNSTAVAFEQTFPSVTTAGTDFRNGLPGCSDYYKYPNPLLKYMAQSKTRKKRGPQCTSYHRRAQNWDTHKTELHVLLF